MKFSEHCPWYAVSWLLTGWFREPSFFIPEARQASYLLKVVLAASPHTAPFLGPRMHPKRNTIVTPHTHTFSSSLGSHLHPPTP